MLKPHYVTCVTFAILTLAGCGQKDEPPRLQPISVAVMVVQPQTVPLTREFVGRLSPTRSADVRARVAGVVQRRLYQEGTEVRASEPLFQIDPTPLRAELERAAAGLARAQADATNAKVVADRTRRLIAQHFVSLANMEDAEAAERSTAAQVKLAQADLQSARIRLSYASVVAPIAGRAGQQQVTEGALVGMNEPTLLTVIEQIDPIYVNFTQSANLLQQLAHLESTGALSPAQGRLQIVLPNGEVYSHPGSADFKGASVDSNTGTVEFRGLVPNPERRLLPGMFVKVHLEVGRMTGVFVVPQAAVLRDARGAFVWTVGDNSRAGQKRISTESMQDSSWIVGDGLSPGDRVIVDGISAVRPDALVKASPVSDLQRNVATAARRE